MRTINSQCFMERWWQRVTKDYLTFSAKERKGLLILFIIGLAAYLISRFYPVNHTSIKPDAFQKELATLKITIDSSSPSYHNYSKKYENDEYNDFDRSNRYDNWKNKNNTKGELFFFDPNTLDEAGWQRLGVKDKTIATIQKFISKGYQFKKPEDLSKIYGLTPQDANRLIPYVQIAGSISNENKIAGVNPVVASSPKYSDSYKNTPVNINLADTAAFIALPGIGSKLANRIVMYRDKLGGFVTIDQVGETYGLQDSIFQKLKSRFVCINPQLKQISINTTDAAALKVHPYIKWNIANAIVNYRTQHGNFKSLDDLKKIDLINDELFQKLKVYLAL